MNIPKELLHGNFGKVFDKLGDLFIEQIVAFLPPPLAKLVIRLTTTNGGDLAYQIALEAWDAWEDDAPLAEVAERAVAKAIEGGLGDVTVKDVADWLGIIDRNPVEE